MRRVTGRATTLVGLALVLCPGVLLVLPARQSSAADTNHSPGAAFADGTGNPITGGNESTQFTLQTPAQSACPGDTATQQFTVNSYLVPDASPETYLSVNYPGGTPTGPGGVVYDDLTAPDFTPYVSEQTQPAVAPSVTGLLPSPALLTFDVYDGFFGATYNRSNNIYLTPGLWDVGLACADKNGNVTDTWNAQVMFSNPPANDPGGFTWTVVNGGGTTTTTSVGNSTTSTTAGGSTTTTAGGSTTTTGGSTTTTGGSTTTSPGTSTTTSSDTSTTATPTGTTTADTSRPEVAPGGGSPAESSSSTGSSGSLASTGASGWLIVLFVGGVALIIGGQGVLLANRRRGAPR
jgi:hypothetical protein